MTDFERLVKKAKITRNLKLLESVHIALLEWLQYLQSRHQKNIKNRNYSLELEIEKIEHLNYVIFGIFAELQRHTHPLDSKSNQNKRM